jgi:hypothetical protein
LLLLLLLLLRWRCGRDALFRGVRARDFASGKI